MLGKNDNPSPNKYDIRNDISEGPKYKFFYWK